jgi:hypothetical protein
MLESLKKLQETREGKFTRAMKKAAEQKTQVGEPDLAYPAQTVKSKAWVWQLVLTVGISLVLLLNIFVLVSMRSFVAKEKQKKATKKAVVSKPLKTKTATAVQQQTKKQH